jgi:hypothetical protein
MADYRRCKDSEHFLPHSPLLLLKENINLEEVRAQPLERLHRIKNEVRLYLAYVCLYGPFTSPNIYLP